MLLIVDNYDSFTYNLLDYFEQLGEECFVVKNDVDPRETIDLNVSKLVLSPGPGSPKDSGFLMDYIAYYSEKVPILGICLGHQALASYFGGEIRKAIRPMHGKISEVIVVKNDDLLMDLPNKWNVVRYHSLIVDLDQSEPIEVLAKTNAGEIMIIRHDHYPLYGIQYHPEAFLTDFGLKILSNWLSTITNKKPDRQVLSS